jgi:chitodextrinase
MNSLIIDNLKTAKIIFLAILLTTSAVSNNLNAETQLKHEGAIQRLVNIAGITYYVDGTTGNDSNPGTQALPWKTIQKAANTMQAGDTVNVNAGTYNERVKVTLLHGSNGSLISFIAQGTVQCQGFRITRNYIRVKGFTVTAIVPGWVNDAYGIYVEGKNCIIEDNYAYYCPTGGICAAIPSANCIFRNNRCYRNVLNGFEIDGINHLIENNEIWGSICYYPPTGWSPTGDTNGVMYWGSGHIFRGNYIHDISYNDPENQGYNPHIDAFQTTPGGTGAGSNILFERNLIVLPEYKGPTTRTHGFMGFGSYVTVRNNIVIAHGGTETGNDDGKTHHVTIVNNTFIGSLAYLQSNWPLGISLENCPYATVKNNIIYDQVGYAIYLLGTTYTGLDIGYNCTYNSNGSTPRGSSGAQQSTDKWGVNPQFVNPASRDYHLLSNSPCINTGVAIYDNTYDYDLNPRPVGSGWDIGAYEYNPDGQKGHRDPVAQFSAFPSQGALPLQVNFDGSASYDPDGSISDYEWDFGNGTKGSGKIINHTFNKKGNFMVTLKVTDYTMRTGTAAKEILTYSKPTALFNSSLLTIKTPQIIGFDASTSYDSYDKIVAYKWSFGDGSSGSGKILIHRFPKKGSYIVTLEVINDQGYAGETSKAIDVSANPRERRR